MENSIKEEWIKVEEMTKNRFGEVMDEKAILFVIGLQELGKGELNFSKEQKLDIIHIGICTVLSEFGHYQFIDRDNEGWPHFKVLKKLPNELQGEHQQLLIKKAILKYFKL